MKHWLLYIMLFSCHYSSAQTPAVSYTDSLVALLPAAKNDTNKTKLLYRIANAFVKSDEKTALHYLGLALDDATKKDFKKGIGACYNSYGDILVNKGLYDSGMVYYLKGYDIHHLIGYKKGEVSALLDIGDAEQRQANDLKAIDYYLKAIKVAEELNETELISRTYIHISTIYFSQQNMVKARELTDKALVIAIKGGYQDLVAESYDKLASIALFLKDSVQAKKNYSKALDIYTGFKNRIGEAAVLSNLGQLQNNLYEGIAYRLKAKAIFDSLSPRHPLAITNTGNLGSDYFELAKNFNPQLLSQHPFLPQQKATLLKNAEINLVEAVALAKETGDQENYFWFLKIKSAILEEKGDYKSALADFKTGSLVQDSIYSQETKNKIAELAGEREIALRDKEISLNQLKAKVQQRQQWALVAGIALIALIGLLLYRQSLNRKRTNTKLLQLNSQLDEANKLKAKFFAIISHDLRSPVASLINFLDIQENAPGLISESESKIHQEKITASAKILLDSMETMLLWSKGQMEHFKPVINSITVSELFDHLNDQFPVSENYQLVFSDADNQQVSSDINYLQTIMYNLTANAIKAIKNSSDKSIEWSVSQEDNKTFLTIKDHGPGLTEQDLDTIKDITPVANSKTGFGFHLIYDLAKAINCNITIQSNEGAGTSFQLALVSR